MLSRFLSKFHRSSNVAKISVGVNTNDSGGSIDKEESTSKMRDCQIQRFERLYRQKARECRDHLERISVFEKQVREKDTSSKEFSQSILSKQNLNDFFEVHQLLMANKTGKVKNRVRHLKAIKNLFIGLYYGLVPMVASQHSRLTSTQLKLIRLVNRKSIADIKDLFIDYTNDFVAIFKTVGKTLEFFKTVCNE